MPTGRPTFAFLKKEGRDRERISVRRFRGAWSQGLLIPVSGELADRPTGADVMADLGIERYEPPIPVGGEGQYVCPPKGLATPKADTRLPGASHLYEGVVILPATERWSDEVDPVAAKVVSNRYLAS